MPVPRFPLTLWTPPRRLTLAALALAALLAVTAVVALATSRSDEPHPANDAAPSSRPSSPEPGGTEQVPPTSAGSASRPPRLSDPLAYARAATRMLWSYDTRTTSHARQLAVMRSWMSGETQYADWPSVAGQMPTPALWARMSDQDQRATATITEARYPSAFKQALEEDPSAITEAYIYAVTVTGKQTITWAGGGQGAEKRSVTLAVQCRPSQDCALVAIAPYVVQ
ncbi:hypothetical protein [Streptomyces fragilis]|uniref:Secreted protein n=1 Tax=Streptomyces fragilis TaxID=67301 RepID=A0ABV2YCB6_9ACTN|nr:hypothetical protein [Streptomyces fragilis]